MRPICALSIGGLPVSAGFMSRLISVTVTDKEGVRADTIDVELDAGPSGSVVIPPAGAIITCALGYEETGAQYMGSFTVDERTLRCLSDRLKIQGKSADMRANLKEHRERHWDNKTVKDVVSQIAGEHGLSPQIASTVGSHKYEWLGQEVESNLHFVERLARRHGATFAIKDGKLIFAEKGSGLTAGGFAIGGIVVTPKMILKDTCEVKLTDRPSYGKVRAPWHDKGAAKRTFEDSQSDSDSEAIYTLRHQFADKDEAQAAADSKGKDLQRSGDTVSVSIEGNPSARGGGGLTFADVHPSINGRPWVIETATHTYSKNQIYTTQIAGKAKV